MSRTTVAILGTLAAVCLVLVQFLPWGGTSDSFFGASAEVEAYTWKMEVSGEGFGSDFSDKENWYSGEFDDAEEDEEEFDTYLLQIRIAIPFLMAGLVLCAVGAIVGFMGRGPSALLVLLGGIAATVATVLFAIAVDGMFDSDQDWGASFYLAIAACALAIIGGIVGLAGGRHGATA